MVIFIIIWKGLEYSYLFQLSIFVGLGFFHVLQPELQQMNAKVGMGI